MVARPTVLICVNSHRSIKWLQFIHISPDGIQTEASQPTGLHPSSRMKSRRVVGQSNRTTSRRKRQQWYGNANSFIEHIITDWHTWISFGSLVAFPLPVADAVNVRLAVPRESPLTVKYAVSWLTLLLSSSSKSRLRIILKNNSTETGQPNDEYAILENTELMRSYMYFARENTQNYLYLMSKMSGVKCGAKVRNSRFLNNSGTPNISSNLSLRVSDAYSSIW